MKPKGTGLRGTAIARRGPDVRIPRIPMEWMDPMSWRLPSGKDLAEFALQAGFLAPLMMGTPHLRRKKAAPADVGNAETQIREEPDHSGTFRKTE